MHPAGGARPRARVVARLFFLGRVGRAHKRTTAALAATIAIVALCGCQTTAEHSSELEKQAKHEKLALRGVTVGSESPSVKVLQSTVVRSSEGTAVVVALRNTSSHTLSNAPIEITVRDAHGGVLFQNNQPGTDPSLTKVPLLEPGRQSVWVDDQVQLAGAPASASALVGEGKVVSGAIPRMVVSGAHRTGEGGAEAGEAGTVTNRSNVAQQSLVVYAVARKGGKVVAAGRAVLAEMAAKASVPFQLYFLGEDGGASIEVSAPATTS